MVSNDIIRYLITYSESSYLYEKLNKYMVFIWWNAFASVIDISYTKISLQIKSHYKVNYQGIKSRIKVIKHDLMANKSVHRNGRDVNLHDRCNM